MKIKKFYICPMSKNIVNSVLSLNDERIGFLPSRRQIDYDGGYVGWDTKQFYEYVNGRTTIQRDHGGENQGKTSDDGRLSYSVDLQYMDIIHVDPWKNVSSVKEGLDKTIEDLIFLYNINSNCKFEVGTEEAIFPLSTDSLLWFLNNLKNKLPNEIFKQIEYVVIQSGVGLDVVEEKNIGSFSFKKLQEEILICEKFGKKSKEHNGDFLSKNEKKLRFDCGLNSINIGPELSVFENSLYIKNLTKAELKEMDRICFESNYWKKWVKPWHDLSKPGAYFKICGHYNYSIFSLPKIDNIEDILKNKILSIIS